MRIEEWEARYRSGERAAEDFGAAPTPLVVEWAGKLAPGVALDLACGTGRNALWLAERGWSVTAVDGSATAVATLMQRARERDLEVEGRVADLEGADFRVEAASWDLILKCYYLQRSLIPAVREGAAAGGNGDCRSSIWQVRARTLLIIARLAGSFVDSSRTGRSCTTMKGCRRIQRIGGRLRK